MTLGQGLSVAAAVAGAVLAGLRWMRVAQREHYLSGSVTRFAWRWWVAWRPLNRLVIAQDTGTAIKGPVRADFFWGFGEDASQSAGRMRQNGRMWLLWPRGEALPRSD